METLSIDGIPPAPVNPGPFNMTAHVLGQAARLSDKSALQIIGPRGAERWSYARLSAAVLGCARGFHDLGLAPGSRVLLRLGNTAEFPVAFLGAIAAGLVPVPTSTQLTQAELDALMPDLAPALVVAGAGVALPSRPIPQLNEDQIRGFETLPPLAPLLGDPDRPAYVLYTSGSSGRPRGVVHAHRVAIARHAMRAGWSALTEADRVLHAGAFNWAYTLGTGLIDPWLVGATALIPAAGVEAAQLPLLLKRFDATVVAAVPGVYRRMLRAGLPPLPRLRHGLSAGEALPETLRAEWRAATGTDLHQALGMTECSTFVSGSPDRPAPAGATGHVQPGRRIAVLDGAGRPVARGTAGELAIDRRDAGLALGYLAAEAEFAARLRGEWFLTGDQAAMDPDGALRYLGRADDMLNAGGYRVSPLEVEAAMATCPGVAEVAAIEVPVAADTTVIALCHTGTADEATLRAHAEACLARYKQPRLYLHKPALPHSANGKVNRRALREDWRSAQ